LNEQKANIPLRSNETDLYSSNPYWQNTGETSDVQLSGLIT